MGNEISSPFSSPSSSSKVNKTKTTPTKEVPQQHQNRQGKTHSGIKGVTSSLSSSSLISTPTRGSTSVITASTTIESSHITTTSDNNTTTVATPTMHPIGPSSSTTITNKKNKTNVSSSTQPSSVRVPTMMIPKMMNPMSKTTTAESTAATQGTSTSTLTRTTNRTASATNTGYHRNGNSGNNNNRKKSIVRMDRPMSSSSSSSLSLSSPTTTNATTRTLLTSATATSGRTNTNNNTDERSVIEILSSTASSSAASLSSSTSSSVQICSPPIYKKTIFHPTNKSIVTTITKNSVIDIASSSSEDDEVVGVLDNDTTTTYKTNGTVLLTSNNVIPTTTTTTTTVSSSPYIYDNYDDDMVVDTTIIPSTTVKKEEHDEKGEHNDTKNTSNIKKENNDVNDEERNDVKRKDNVVQKQQQQQQQSLSEMNHSIPIQQQKQQQRCIVYVEEIRDFFGRVHHTLQQSTKIIKQVQYHHNHDHYMLGYIIVEQEQDTPKRPLGTTTTTTTTCTVQLDNQMILYKVPRQYIYMLVSMDEIPIMQQATLLNPKSNGATISDEYDNDNDDNDDDVLYPIDCHGNVLTNLSVLPTTMNIKNQYNVQQQQQQQSWFCHRNPKVLYIGDVVQVYYQNGNQHLQQQQQRQKPSPSLSSFTNTKENDRTTSSSNSNSIADSDTNNVIYDAWYRGRICDVRTITTNDESLLQHIDIAYDDGDIEYNVPFVVNSNTTNHNNHIILLRRGYQDLSWLQDLNFTIKGKGIGSLYQIDPTVFRSTTTNKYNSYKNNNIPIIPMKKYEKSNQHGRGVKPPAATTLSYMKIVSAIYYYELYVNPIRKDQHVAYQWPIPTTTTTTSAFVNVANVVAPKKKTLTIATKTNTKTTKRPAARTTATTHNTKKRIKKENYSDDDDDDDDYDDSNVPLHQNSAPSIARTRSSQSRIKKERNSNDDCNTDDKVLKPIKVELPSVEDDKHVSAVVVSRVSGRRIRKVNYSDNKLEYEDSFVQLQQVEKDKEVGLATTNTTSKRGGNANNNKSSRKTRNTNVATKKATTMSKVVTKRKSQASDESIHPASTPDKKMKTSSEFGPIIRVNQDVQAVLETEWDWLTRTQRVPVVSPTNQTIDNDRSIGRRSENTVVTVMDNSIANPLGDALHSSNAVMATELLTFLSCMHNNTIPNDTMWKYILELNTFGPKIDNVCYPDTTKMKVAFEYIQHILTIPTAIDRCCTYIDQQFRRFNGLGCGTGRKKGSSGYGNQIVQLSYVETFSIQMLSNYYMAPMDTDGSCKYCSSDIQRHSIPSYERIYATLHAKACYAEVFIQLLQHQLRTIVINDHVNSTSTTSTTTKSDINTSIGCLDYHTLPIVRDILNGRGVKSVLESTIKALMVVLVQFAIPFVFDDQSRIYQSINTHNDNISILLIMKKIHTVIDQLVTSLGMGISYVAWLYKKELNEDTYAIADIIGRIYDQEINVLYGTESITKSSKQKQKQQQQDNNSNSNNVTTTTVQLRIIESINKSIIPQLRPKIAERFHIAGLYNVLYNN